MADSPAGHANCPSGHHAASAAGRPVDLSVNLDDERLLAVFQTIFGTASAANRPSRRSCDIDGYVNQHE
jgi:hypothetical protein